MPRYRHFQTTPSLTQDVNHVDIVGAILSSCGHSLLSRSLVGQVGKQSKTAPAFFVAFASIKIKFAQLARKNRVLENENLTLKNELSGMRSDKDFVQSELQVFRDRAFGLVENERKHIAEAVESQQIIKSLEAKVEQYGEFIRTLVDLKLDNPVKRAALSVMNGEDFEEALVNAVQVACQNKSSAWSRIVPAISGPRSPENYVSALNLTLRARKDLRERTKKSDFWKSKARMIPENGDLVTPSSSMLSDMRDEAAQAKTTIKSLSPPPVLEDMLDTLKRGQSWPPRQDATESFESQSLQPLLLNSMEKDLISESSSILSEEIRHSLKLLPVRLEEVATPLGILKNGNTAVTTSGTCKDTLSPRIVRFAPHQENTIIMRPPSIDSTTSSLSYVSENTGDCAQSTGPMETQSHGTTHNEDNEFSGSDSVLSDVYADFLNETQVEDVLADPAHTLIDSGGPGQCTDANDERLKPAVDTDWDSSGSEYSASDMCDEEDFAPQGTQGEHFVQRNGFKGSFTSAPASDVISSASDLSQACDEAKGKGFPEHRRLPSIEEEDIVSEEPHAVEPESTALLEAVHSDLSSSADKEPPITTYSVDEIPNETFNKRYGRITISQPMPNADSVLKSREFPIALIPRTLTRDISPNTATATAPLHIDDGGRGKTATSPSLSVDVSAKRPAEGKQGDVRKITERQESSAQSSIPVAPPRSRLDPPRSVIPKRPVLQEVNTNTPAALPWAENEVAKSDAQRISLKPSAKELGKRRGVIMVEKPNINSAVRNSVIVGHSRNLSRDNSVSTKYASCSIGRSGPNSRPHVNDNENVSKPTEKRRRVQKPTSAPITPTRPPRTRSRTPMMLSELERSLKHMSAKAGTDVSAFDSNVAELLDSMSSSDLGSLEPSEPDDSDSDCEVLRAVQNDAQEFAGGLANSPHVGKSLQTSGTANKSTAIVPRTSRKATSTTSSTSADSISGACLGSSRRLPPPGPRGACKKHSSVSVTASSDSASSSESSGPSSFGVESPTVSRISHRESRFGFARTPVRLDKLSPVSSKMILPAERDIALSTLRYKQSEGGPSEPKFSPPPSSLPSSSVRTPFASFANGAKNPRAVMESLSKASPSPSKPSAMSESRSPSSQFTPERSRVVLPPISSQPKPWPVLGVSGKGSPSQLKSKPNVTSATTSRGTGLVQQTTAHTLVPPSTLSNKPRANTINTISPLPPRYHTPMNLTADSPTKPRSNTVNSISPHVRSPLSQAVVNTSDSFQTRLNHAPQPTKRVNEGPPPLSPVRPLETKIVGATGVKSTAPLQIVKKGATVSKAREARPSPPTAAFMRPALSPPTPTVRRISSSVTPLIPNWGTRAGGFSVSQARSMLRSNNVSMR